MAPRLQQAKGTGRHHRQRPTSSTSQRRDPRRKHCARYQRSLYQGPNARREAEEAERARSVETVAMLFVGMPTPLAELPSTDWELEFAGWRQKSLYAEVKRQSFTAVLVLVSSDLPDKFPQPGCTLHRVPESSSDRTQEQGRTERSTPRLRVPGRDVRHAGARVCDILGSARWM